jgi:hypothetical protein
LKYPPEQSERITIPVVPLSNITHAIANNMDLQYNRTDSKIQQIQGGSGDTILSSSQCLVIHTTRTGDTTNTCCKEGVKEEDDTLLPKEQGDIPRNTLFTLLRHFGMSECALLCKLVLPISVTGLLEFVMSLLNVFALGYLGATGKEDNLEHVM